jgi:citronellol/citronellal dehydrogenase
MQRIDQINQQFAPNNVAWVSKFIETHTFHKVGDLKGKTLVITGASRGIGLEIGKKAARDGANVAILAKTVTPHPKLEGTIYTAAKEIEKCGGKALAIKCDIRDEKSVQAAIDETVKTFGGIDILINNASAIYNTPVEDTEMKRFDLAMSINTRGTFLASKLCIPHLRKSNNPHILTISPPLYISGTKTNWFARTGTGYVMAKYGMTLITHGLAEELANDGIACNTLWPRTAIATAAVQNLLGGDSSINGSRIPEIMGDSAYYILTSDSKKTTDQFFIDDEVMVSNGVYDLSKYKVNPNLPDHKLMTDFMI